MTIFFPQYVLQYLHTSVFETICVSNPHVEVAKQILFSQGGLSLRTREATIGGDCLDGGEYYRF